MKAIYEGRQRPGRQKTLVEINGAKVSLTAAKTYRLYETVPGINQVGIARELNVSLSRIRQVVRELKDAGLIQTQAYIALG